MANSRLPGPATHDQHPMHHRHRRHTSAIPAKPLPPPRTPGPLGHNDQADPTRTSWLGWTPNLTGVRDWVDHTLHEIEDWASKALGGTGIDKKTGAPVAVGAKPPAIGGLDLSFLGDYTGGEVTAKDIRAAAADINCEPGLIYAIAKQESAKASFISLQGRMVPTILYERHQFKRWSSPNANAKKGPYHSVWEQGHHEICGPAYHPRKEKSGLINKDEDVYGPSGRHQYERLDKAYALDRAAALKACSWGKFQLMGFNHIECGYGDVFSFVKAMSSGDSAHLKAFVKFAKTKAILRKGLQTNNYEMIAEGHNGEDWRTVNPHYAENIEKYSKEFK